MRQRRSLRLGDGSALDYDLLSLNLGSTLNPPSTAAASMLSMRPLARLHDAWDTLLRRWPAEVGTIRPTASPPSVVAPRASNRCSPRWRACVHCARSDACWDAC